MPGAGAGEAFEVERGPPRSEVPNAPLVPPCANALRRKKSGDKHDTSMNGTTALSFIILDKKYMVVQKVSLEEMQKYWDSFCVFGSVLQRIGL